jgi:hypothetical protein
MVDMSKPGGSATVSFPYEYLPVPEAGDHVRATDRAGREICDAKVVDVKRPKSYNKTAVITIEVPKALAHEARGIALAWRQR